MQQYTTNNNSGLSSLGLSDEVADTHDRRQSEPVGRESCRVFQTHRHQIDAAVEDCWAVTKWVANNASTLGVDPDRMAVTGESAGGDMTAVLTFLAKDNDAVNFVYQLPIYPVTDLSESWVGQLPETFSIAAPEDDQQLDRRYLVPEDLTWFGDRYLPYDYAAQNLYTVLGAWVGVGILG